MKMVLLKMAFELTLLLFLGYIHCYTVVPNRAELEYTNSKYIEDAQFNIRRYSRKSPYYMNLVFTSKHTWNNNITVHVILEEFMHNEYRPSFVEFHFALCDMINKDAFVGKMCKDSGLVCPLPKGEVRLQNMTVPMGAFTNVFPFEKFRSINIIEITKTKELLFKGYVYGRVVEEKNDRKNRK